MDFQTQVVDQGSIQAEISAQQMVSKFKDILAGFRVQQVTAIQKKQAVRDQILTLIQSRNQIIALYKDAIRDQFPDIVDVGQALRSSTPDSDIRIMWEQYSRDIQPIVSNLESLLIDFKSLSDEIESLKEKEGQTLSDYAEASKSSSVAVPSAQEIEADLVSVEAIPYSEDADVYAKIPAIELLDPDTADAITLEQANLEEQTAIASAQAHIERKDFYQELGISKPTLIFGGLFIAYLLFR